MAAFDEQLAELQAQLAAATKVLNEHPEIAEKVSLAMAIAQPDPVKAEEAAQDDARANALARTLDAARASLPAPPEVDLTAINKKEDRPRGPQPISSEGATGATGATGAIKRQDSRSLSSRAK